jgi:hypothetical protein
VFQDQGIELPLPPQGRIHFVRLRSRKGMASKSARSAPGKRVGGQLLAGATEDERRRYVQVWM